MQVIGIDHRVLIAKSFFEVETDEVELVVALAWGETDFPGCDHAQTLDWSMPDPTSAPRSERLEAFRATRDDLLRRLSELLDVETPL